eukprot:2659476-Prymnesium_polylepis.2
MQPLGQLPGHLRRVVPAQLEHRPLGQPCERQAARPPIRRHAEPATAGLREAQGLSYNVKMESLA